jgi:hypothetical protein
MTLRADLFLGGADTPRLLDVGSGYTDDGEIYELVASSRPWAPAGADMECAFYYAHLTSLHYADDVSWWLAAVLDGTAIAGSRLDLLGVIGSTGERQNHVLSLLQPTLRGDREVGRHAPRGTWFQLQLYTNYAAAEVGAAFAAAQQILETATLEFEAIRARRPLG